MPTHSNIVTYRYYIIMHIYASIHIYTSTFTHMYMYWTSYNTFIVHPLIVFYIMHVCAYYIPLYVYKFWLFGYKDLPFLLLLGCGSRHAVIQSPRMHLISDSCPLKMNMYHMGNGSFFRSVRLRKCHYKQGGFLQARLQLIPVPLVYRVSGCDVHGNHFERSILTPFFTPRIAMLTLTRDPSNDVSRTNTSSIVSFTVQSMEHEPVTVSFKVGLRLAKDSDSIM